MKLLSEKLARLFAKIARLMFVIAVFIISLSLQAVSGRATPVPRQAADDNAYGTANVDEHGKSSKNPPSPVRPFPNELPGRIASDNPADRVPHHDTEQAVIIREPTAAPEKSWWDKFYVIFTGLLVAAGIAGIWYAYQTLKTIRRQSRTMVKQALLMRRSTVATERSIRLQEVQLRQWVDVTDIQTHINSVQGRVPEGITQTELFISFFITNPTGMILTLNWVIIRIDGHRQKPQIFNRTMSPSSDPVRIDTSITLEGRSLEAYKQYALGISVIVYVGYTDAFNRPQKEHSSCMCNCGPPASTRVYPHKGDIADDDIQESDKNPA